MSTIAHAYGPTVLSQARCPARPTSKVAARVVRPLLAALRAVRIIWALDRGPRAFAERADRSELLLRYGVAYESTRV